MAPKLQDTDLFLPVKTKTNKITQSRVSALKSTSPTSVVNLNVATAKVKEPDTASDQPIRQLRHKRRFTIGGVGQRPDTLEISPVPSVGKNLAAGHDSIKHRPTVTISRSPSSRRSTRTTTPAKDIGELHPSGLQPDITNVGRLSPTPATNVDADSLNSRSSRSRSPRAQYPPSSWKNVQRVEPPAFNTAETSKLGNPLPGENRDAVVSPQRPSLGKSRHTEPVLAEKPVVDIWTEIAGISTLESLGKLSPRKPTPQKNSMSPARQPSSTQQNLPVQQVSGVHTTPIPPKTTQPKYIRSRRRSNSVGPSAQRPSLPDPEIAYADTFHYTSCEHTSPPMSRPLNAQPILVKYHDELLAYPPLHLRAYFSSFPAIIPSIYIIEGACSICDLSYRREAESDILARYTTRLENLILQLSLLQEDIDVESPDAANQSGRNNTATSSPSSNATRSAASPTTTSPTIMSPENIQAILQMEDQADNLLKQRDNEVKAIWRGYTERWGPATVGIHHEGNVLRGRRRAQSASDSVRFPEVETSSSLTSNVDASTDRTSTMASTVSTRTTQTSHTSRTVSSVTTPRRMSMSRRTSRSSSIEPRERYSDGSRSINVPSTVDGVLKEGRMMVDWIRSGPGSGSSRSQSRSQSHSRSRSRI
ncbi:hypothetical protein PV05_10896 [Exophiala xenobiotica]|uniref:Uncharacterized protein n=1 Tax=Exophiala xenobiotica TaxID=348802 RepID=A0A0D2CH54_9EURO|nr:uncharacterized protein PV05_10896 [Exophiala xenobiotica]KIW49197.1 hypothetical protein PV05_10896 [Exophiala xenobiotica]